MISAKENEHRVSRHPHQWTRESIASFWDHNVVSKTGVESYFTKRWGAEIIRFAEFIRPVRNACVLDFGCGLGFLSEQLLEQGAIVTAIEYSDESAALVNERFGKHPGWTGCHILGGNLSGAVESGRYDMVFCIETIEHPLEADLEKLFGSILEALKPGGVVVFTTPNTENLQSNQVFCPECGAEFHRWQHLRQWTPAGLNERLGKEGFNVVFCRGMSFHVFMRKFRISMLDMSVRLAIKSWGDHLAGYMDMLFPKKFPQNRVLQRLLKRCWSHNLVAVARKPHSV